MDWSAVIYDAIGIENKLKIMMYNINKEKNDVKNEKQVIESIMINNIS